MTTRSRHQRAPWSTAIGAGSRRASATPAAAEHAEQTPVPWPRRSGDAGMATAEYAVATLAACGFAGLLVAVLSGGEVQEMLLSIVRRALTLG